LRLPLAYESSGYCSRLHLVAPVKGDRDIFVQRLRQNRIRFPRGLLKTLRRANIIAEEHNSADWQRGCQMELDAGILKGAGG
jgi:hypothetical protein